MQTSYSDVDVPSIAGARIGILQAKWYAEHTDTMIARCKATLAKADCTDIVVHVLPGSLELPIAAQILLRETTVVFDALICFGAIVKGDTYHFEMVADECTRGLGEVSRATDVPIISEVLAVNSLDQLIIRSSDDDNNKGIEAALATIEFIAWRRSLA